MNINYSTENFRREIYGTINQSKLPVSTLYFVLKDVFNDVTGAYEAAVKREALEIQRQQSENNTETDIIFNEEE